MTETADRAPLWKLETEYRAHLQEIAKAVNYSTTCWNNRAGYFQELEHTSVFRIFTRRNLHAMIRTATHDGEKAQSAIEKLRLQGEKLKMGVLVEAYRSHQEAPLGEWELHRLTPHIIPNEAKNDANGCWKLTPTEQATWLTLRGEEQSHRTEAEALQRAAHKVTNPDPLPTARYSGHGVMAL